MSNRIFRLSISPEDFPEVRRVIDFDGRHTLHDVHELMHSTLSIGDSDHLYAFFLSGRYWDRDSEYVDPRTDGARADRAMLFRLKLRPGQEFVYLYDYGEEHRFSLTVVSVSEAPAPLLEPMIVESIGEAPVSPDGPDFEHEGFDDEQQDEQPEGDREEQVEEPEHRDPELREPLKLAAAVLKQIDALDPAEEDTAMERARPQLRELAESTLAFLTAIDGRLKLLSVIDRECELELVQELLGIPRRLSEARETALAVDVAEALKFCAPDDMNGEVAIAYAAAGERERALARVLTNLETATEPFIAENKAGDVYRALGEYDAAEAYYRRGMAIAQSPTDRQEAALHVASLMIETGREADAAAFVAEQRAALTAPGKNRAQPLPAVGRNEPCPCGSGKKYKKCHGT